VIARISGRLEEVAADGVLIDSGSGLWYEVLVPACDLQRLTSRVGQDIVLHTIHYIEGDPSRGGQSPRLIGFASEADRDFFKLFTKVKGIGVRKALRALVRPAGEIAAAIQNKDIKMLIALPEVGRRTAETMVAELHGKVDQFAGPPTGAGPEISPVAEQALAVLVQLGERRADAMALVQRVLAVAPDTDSPELIVQQVYRLKAGG